MKTAKVLKTDVSIAPYRDIVNNICELGQKRVSSYVCFANAHMLIEAYDNNEFCNVVNHADIVTADGRPLSIMLRIARGIKQDRVCGMDLLPDLLRQAEVRNESVYFYGSTREVLQRIRIRASKEFPHLKIAGMYSPPFRELSSQEKESVVEEINSSGANLVLVALGCPKQEKWMADHKGKIQACMLGLGQAFNVYAGIEKRLPRWMRNLSLEWVYRLYLEPKRLWRRYVYGNSRFIALAGKQLLGRLS